MRVGETVVVEGFQSGYPVLTSTIANLGVTDGSDAAPGIVGEYVVEENTTGANVLSTAPASICSLNLTPGVWEIWGLVDFLPASNKSPNMICASVSLYPDALPSDSDLYTGIGVMTLFYTTALSSGARQVLMTGQCRANTTTPLTVYLVAETSFTGGGSVLAKGYISARRVR
jgi:hypothetical protein